MTGRFASKSSPGALTFPFESQLGGGGHVEFDRPLPLVCVHDRTTSSHPHDRSLELLTQGAPSHVVVDNADELDEATTLIGRYLRASIEEFGRCLVAELRSSAERRETTPTPSVTLRSYGSPPEGTSEISDALEAFEAELTRRKIRGLRPLVMRAAPAMSRPLLEPFGDPRVTRIVLELSPVFFSPREARLRGLLLRDFAERLQPALAELAFSLLDAKGKRRLRSPCALGRRNLHANVDVIAGELARISQSFDLLLLLTPINGEAAYHRFTASGCEKRPEFVYRTIYVDPDEFRRSLYQLPIEKVYDPTLARLLRDQREHLDGQLGMVAHRNTSKCLYGSLHVYGSVEDKLYRVARGIAETFGSDAAVEAGDDGRSEACYSAEDFCSRVRAEFDFYKKQWPAFDAKVEIRDDVSSLLVSENTLFVPRTTVLSKRRTDALLAHEVGTHLLTYNNGRSQPLGLMKTGLAGYDQLQEGLAVVAEYLAGGLTPERLRLLAARVIAVRHLLSGGDFVEVFREMHKTLALPKRHAFFVTLRVFRGGGFTKDAIYLRGVLDVLEHLRQERPFEMLLTGKFSIAHAPLIDELHCRQLLKAPRLLPRALKTVSGKRYLSALVGQPRTVFDLCQREAS